MIIAIFFTGNTDALQTSLESLMEADKRIEKHTKKALTGVNRKFLTGKKKKKKRGY